MEDIDRNNEMERLRLQKKKKELRDELKIELEYEDKTPYERLNQYWWYKGLGKRNTTEKIVVAIKVLERLIAEDLKKDPDVADRWFNSLSKQQKSLLRIEKK
jgi:hypothetical protein